MAEPIKSPRSQKRLAPKVGRGFSSQVLYHLYTIWLFTLSDLRTTCLQTVLFGLAGAASGRLTTPTTTTITHSISVWAAAFNLLGTSLRAFLFVWLLLLVLQLDNQSMPGGPEEDALNNKAWRSIPSGRISQSRVRDILLPSTIIVALLVSFILGVQLEAAGFVAASYIYNQLGGGDVNPVIRNLLNGVGLTLLNSGSLKLAAAYSKEQGAFVDGRGYVWILAVGLVISTTIQTQDFRDQEGDAARGRWTLPLVIGDGPARLVTAASMLVWAFLCPWICGAGFVGYSLSVVTACVAAFGLLVYRTRSADGLSFKLWSVWLTVVYLMPWLASFR
ncbi:heterokaryon incompatibility protein-domain-containing protein [Apiospora arundinis]